jgi:hypothetical protein
MHNILKAAFLLFFFPGSLVADEAVLGISIEGGAFNSKFKFFDASDGCPDYRDVPGAKGFLGEVFASSKSRTKKLPKGELVHVFLFRPKEVFGISAAGGPEEIRRRALQVTLTEDSAELVYTGFEDNVPNWRASDGVVVEPATACAPNGEGQAEDDVDEGLQDDAEEDSHHDDEEDSLDDTAPSAQY